MAHGDDAALSPLLGSSKNSGQKARAVGRFVLGGIMLITLVAWLYFSLKLLDDPFRFGVLVSVTHFKDAFILGNSVPVLLVFALPVVGLAAVAPFYTALAPPPNQKKRRPSFWERLWTYPVAIRGPLGILTVAEVLGIIVFVAAVAAILVHYTLRIWALIQAGAFPIEHAKWLEKWGYGSAKLGLTGLVVFSFLLFPVARNSVLLRAVDIPWERAVRFHTWLATLMLAIFTVHGVSFIIIWTIDGDLVEKLFEWLPTANAHLPGFLALLVGWAMWATSLKPVRLRHFERFYYTHHLYALFVVLLIMHIGDFEFPVALLGLFLFMVDRFLRAVQSRRAVGLLGARRLPCGSLELVIPKPFNASSSPLGFLFLNVRGVSRFQWHPFSVTSSPLRTPGSFSVLVKPSGDFTRQLAEHAAPAGSQLAEERASKQGCPFGVVLGVEGPYGHSSNFYLKYDALVLVAGGIGITPFLAIVRDLLTRHHLAQPDLPSSLTLVWAVKHEAELDALAGLTPALLCPGVDSLQVEARVHVTSESAADPEQRQQAREAVEGRVRAVEAGTPVTPMVPLAGSDSPAATAAILLASLLGFLIFQGLFNHFVVFPAEGGVNGYVVFPWWIRGLAVLVAMALGIVLFGGTVVAVWYCFERKELPKRDEGDEVDEEAYAARTSSIVNPADIVYGSRPDVPAVLEGVAKRLPGANVGVLVCGPESLQEVTAHSCRAMGFSLSDKRATVFNYHSVSFNL